MPMIWAPRTGFGTAPQTGHGASAFCSFMVSLSLRLDCAATLAISFSRAKFAAMKGVAMFGQSLVPNIRTWSLRKGAPNIAGPVHSHVITYGSRAMVVVKLDDLSMAFDFVNYAAPMEHNAYVSLDRARSIGHLITTTPSTRKCLTTLKLRTGTLRYRIRTISILEKGSPCGLSHRSCLRATTGSKDFSDGNGLTRASRICWSAKVFSICGIRLKPTLSKGR
jgi:hypothetical protein